MEIYFFSKATGGFYVPGIHDSIPADAKEITLERRIELDRLNSQGKLIVGDEDGYPIAIDQPPASDEELRGNALAARDQLLAQANLRIAPLQDAIDIGEALPAEEQQLLAWKRYRVALNRIEQTEGFPRSFSWPDPPAASS